MKTFSVPRLVAAFSILLCLYNPSVAEAQTGEWKVWVKTSPCSGRFDWITVAKTNPTIGGTSYYYLANQIFPGTSCTNFGCTFAEATAIATSLRTSSEFSKYCCRDYSVWQNLQTRQMSVVVGKFGTAGLGWAIVKGDLCCEEAEALAGIPGACSGTTNPQTQVNNTQCYPGSYAAWNAQLKRVECYCNPGLVWNATKTACVKAPADCSGYPGSYAAWSQQNNRWECWCPEGKVWNSTNTACIDKTASADCSMYPGTVAQWSTANNRWECMCPSGKVWNAARNACVDQATTADCSMYPGTVAQWSTTNNRWECMCPSGKVWNAARNACIDEVTTPDCSMYPGTTAQWSTTNNRWECLCPSGKVWNAARNSCVDQAATADCSGYPGSYAAWNQQNNRWECWCPQGKVWNSTKTACVDASNTGGADCSGYPGSYAAWNQQNNRWECWCPQGKVWNSTQTACIDAGSTNTGTTGSGIWSLISVTSAPASPAQGWSFSSGTAHWDVYNGDKCDFQWTPPPASFGSGGFTVTISTVSTPSRPGTNLQTLIGVNGGSLTSETPAGERLVYGSAVNGTPASASKSITFRPGSYTGNEVEVQVGLMWGGVAFYYKYRKTQ